MKLLLDENVSDRIVEGITDLFPGSTHIKSVSLMEADDRIVWDWDVQRAGPGGRSRPVDIWL